MPSSKPERTETFVSEQITPVEGAACAAGMVRGEPGLPTRFVWRDHQYAVTEVVKAWKESGPCKTGCNERYLRKHWYTVRTDDGSEMTLYFERQPRSKAQAKQRWWLYTIVEG